MTSHLIERLDGLLGPSIAVRGPEGSHDLWPEEAAALARAIPTRKTEFAAGRSAARAALAALGHPAQAIPVGPDRAPIWPKGIVGSITHTQGLCLAAVARVADIAALGIDAERADPLPQNILDTVLTEDDKPQLPDLPPFATTAIFSAKEAVYKALSPELAEIWDFDAMSIRLDLSAGQFDARLHRDAQSFKCGEILRGVLLKDETHLLTAIYL